MGRCVVGHPLYMDPLAGLFCVGNRTAQTAGFTELASLDRYHDRHLRMNWSPRRGVRSYAIDPIRAEALWTRSEEMVGETFSF